MLLHNMLRIIECQIQVPIIVNYYDEQIDVFSSNFIMMCITIDYI